MKIRKVAALLLVLLLLVASLILPGCEPSKYKEGNRYGDLYYEVDAEKGDVTINACEESATGKLSIPKKIDGKPVTGVRTKAFENCNKLTEIVIPDSVEYLGDEAFAKCTALKTVTIGNGVDSLDKFAFYHCTALEKIVLGAGIERIYGGDDYEYTMPSYHQSNFLDEALFCDNAALAWVEVSEDNRTYSSVDGVLYNKEKTKLLYCPEAKKDTLSLPATVEELDFDLLKRCPVLQGVSIDASHTEYTSIDGVVYNKKVTKLLYCPIGKKGTLVIPDSITNVDCKMLKECTALTAVQVGDNHPTLSSEDGVLFSKDKKSLYIYPCAKAGAYTIPAGVQDVTPSSFGGCTKLTAIHVDAANVAYSSVDGVLYDKFQSRLLRCPEGKAGAYTIPDSVTKIDAGAFTDCHKLTAVTIGDGIHFADNYFSSCNKLEKIVLGAGVYTIYHDEFGGFFDDCDALTTIEVDKDNKWYTAKDGVLFNKDKTVLLRYPQAKKGAYTVPDGVKKIDEAAFAECSGLTSVTVPDSVTEIGRRAFFECKALTEVKLGKGVSVLKDWTFDGCSALQTLTLTKSVKQVSYDAFSDCDGLKDVYYDGTRGDRKQIRDPYDLPLEHTPLQKATWHYTGDANMAPWVLGGILLVIVGVPLMLFLLLRKKKPKPAPTPTANQPNPDQK